MKNLYLRAYAETTIEAEGPIRFVASTEGIARDGMVIEAGAWNLDNYRRNPVVLWAHDYMGRNLPIGRAEARVEDGNLIADVVFDEGDPFAAQVARKYRAGFLNAVSVGWATEEMRPARAGEAARIVRADLLDISAVPVPSDPNALMERSETGVRSLADWLHELLPALDPPAGEPRGAVPPHSTPKAAADAAYDYEHELEASAPETARQMHAWSDGERYELPHHLATGEVVWAGVAAAMARLLGYGAGIPDDDREATYKHLERHYRQFGRTAPEYLSPAHLNALEMSEIRGLFLEGEEAYLEADAPGPEQAGETEYEDLYASLLVGLARRIGK